MLPQIESEESREDVIAATSIFRDDKLRDKIEEFVRKRFPGMFDNSVQTALIVLAMAGPPDHFRTFYKSLGDLTKDKKDIDRLRDFWDSGFRDRAPTRRCGGNGTEDLGRVHFHRWQGRWTHHVREESFDIGSASSEVHRDAADQLAALLSVSRRPRRSPSPRAAEPPPDDPAAPFDRHVPMRPPSCRWATF